MTKNRFFENGLPYGKVLMIHPHYVHYSGEFMEDKNPFLPVGLLYAGAILEKNGREVHYYDLQLHNLAEINGLETYDSIGINVMGAQNITPAQEVYRKMIGMGVKAHRIYLGGQGVEGLLPNEFERIFPDSNQVPRTAFLDDNYWRTTIEKEIEKFSEDDLKTYFSNELTVLLSQGCKYNCSFCGAQTKQHETFYNTKENLEGYMTIAKELGINELSGYVTSLDFFQQSLTGGKEVLKKELIDIIKTQEKYGIKIKLRALTRADSYMRATEDKELMKLVKEAGFYQFGFGADGAADPRLLREMRKGTRDLKSHLLNAFEHAEKNGFAPEILYVFGITGDTEETLQKTKELCEGLLENFKDSIYRGFPAKDFIPGNLNWLKPEWRKSTTYKTLLDNPELFLNLGFETLANHISHPDEDMRKLVNKYAVDMSHFAHNLGRVQSYLTVPIMENDGRELMDEETFGLFKKILENYVPPQVLKKITLKNLPEHREELNRLIPKDT